MPCMRTTIRIDDDLYRRVKARAATEGRPVAELIADALRVALAPERDDSRQLPELPTYGGSGTLEGVDLSSNADLRELMEADEPVDALH